MKFYCPDGKQEISREKFIEFYSNSYYLNQGEKISNASQSSCYVEAKIDCLLKNGIKEEKDVARILAWKIGKINHRESASGFEYAKDWQDAEQLRVKRYGKEFDLERLASSVVRNIGTLENKAKTDPQGVLNWLNGLGIAGMGPVYMVTLLYFISRGAYPIYDRFARKALTAICEDKNPLHDEILYKELPEKGSKRFKNLMCKEMKEYCEDLESVFGDAYKTDRNIDRALWVYGHLHIETQKKACR